MTLNEFDRWFADHDLAHLEVIRDYVYLHAVQNNDDQEDLSAAKFTVEMYLDDDSLGDPLLEMYAGRF